ncbi:hypothetical protein JCM3774_003999, partial [Rhodotorula dairenensis]
SEHKIQSGKGSLVIEMDQVPKVLKTMVDEWSNEGFVVSFKLETDPTILIPKARQAIERYGHQIVVGNLLATRKSEVVFVTKESEMWLRVPYVPLSEDPSSMHHHEIEEDITEHLTELHEAWTRGKPLPIAAASTAQAPE